MRIPLNRWSRTSRTIVCSTSIRTHRDKLWPTASPQSQSSRNGETNCSPELEPFHQRRFSEVMSPAVWVLGRRAIDCLRQVRRTCPRRSRISQSVSSRSTDRLLTRYVQSFLVLRSVACGFGYVDHFRWQSLRQRTPVFTFLDPHVGLVRVHETSHLACDSQMQNTKARVAVDFPTGTQVLLCLDQLPPMLEM